MEGLVLEALVAERIKDLQRAAATARGLRRPRRVRRPEGSWVLAGSVPNWLR